MSMIIHHSEEVDARGTGRCRFDSCQVVNCGHPGVSAAGEEIRQVHSPENCGVRDSSSETPDRQHGGLVHCFDSTWRPRKARSTAPSKRRRCHDFTPGAYNRSCLAMRRYHRYQVASLLQYQSLPWYAAHSVGEAQWCRSKEKRAFRW